MDRNSVHSEIINTPVINCQVCPKLKAIYGIFSSKDIIIVKAQLLRQNLKIIPVVLCLEERLQETFFELLPACLSHYSENCSHTLKKEGRKNKKEGIKKIPILLSSFQFNDLATLVLKTKENKTAPE